MAKKHHAPSNKRAGKRSDISAAKDGGFPITVKLDPEIQAVPFIKALSLVGLKIGKDKTGQWWIKKEPDGWAERLPEPEKTQVIGGIHALLTAVIPGRAEAQQEHRQTIAKQIEEQRGELFGVMAVLGLARGYVQSWFSGEDYDLRRAMEDAYKRLDTIAAELNVISTDAGRDAQ